MRNFIACLVLGVFVMAAVPFSAMAQSETTVTVDLSDLDSNSRNAIIKALKKQESVTDTLSKVVDPKAASEWAMAVTGAIKEVCKTLNIEVNEFVKTPVGMMVAGLIVYKVIGKDVILYTKNIFFGIVGWVLSMLILYFIAKKFVLPLKVKQEFLHRDEDGKETRETTYKFVKPYDFRSEDAKTTVVSCLSIAAGATTLVAMIAILG